ncbi:MAG: ankyrin repeat domain-containing protein [Bacteriovoracia bacterium]
MNNKRAIISAASLLGIIAVSTFWLLTNPKTTDHRSLTDEALLALIKNDHKAFENFIHAGGKVHDNLPEIDGKIYTVAQGIAYFERTKFGEYLSTEKHAYVNQNQSAPYDIMTIATKKNNPDLLKQLAKEKPKFDMTYGKNGWTLLHMASAWCSDKLTSILHEEGKLNWDLQAKDGTTPLTLAALNDCLPMLSYWKEKGADFRAKDGKGQTALSILKKKKDAALSAFAESFEERKIATVTVVKKIPVPDFYKKRKIPKEQIVDHAAMLEPEDRPLEATETAEFSEFAD